MKAVGEGGGGPTLPWGDTASPDSAVSLDTTGTVAPAEVGGTSAMLVRRCWEGEVWGCCPIATRVFPTAACLSFSSWQLSHGAAQGWLDRRTPAGAGQGPSRGGGADFITHWEQQNWFGSQLGQRNSSERASPGVKVSSPGASRRDADLELPCVHPANPGGIMSFSGGHRDQLSITRVMLCRQPPPVPGRHAPACGSLLVG